MPKQSEVRTATYRREKLSSALTKYSLLTHFWVLTHHLTNSIMQLTVLLISAVKKRGEIDTSFCCI